MIAILKDDMIQDFQQGSEKAFQMVFDHYYRRLVGFVSKLTDNEQEAQDISLRTFQTLFKRCQLFNSENNIRAFLYVSARNNSLNYLKAKKRLDRKKKTLFEKLSNDTRVCYAYSITEDVVEIIQAAIEALPPESKRVFKMLYYEDLKPSEIAEILQISVNTVYNHKSLAIKKLRLLLAENSVALAWLVQVAIFCR
ncbi:RNA polymerase sigma factor [Niastella sp. OAS944]|uniref:RNA polymerase sigma factor n=1 Tax=Niastella sp. OAS944 TaxID=2664089 RepID=UPI003486ABA6|nr:RNA polymerase sigma-70 factor (ECF subfamily) [Chitinophagaceae bacterium OAS944]